MFFGLSLLFFSEILCTKVPGKLKQVDAGAGQVYGVNDDDNIYQWVNNNWKEISGKLIHVTVGPAGVWGANRANIVYHLQDNNWVPVTGKRTPDMSCAFIGLHHF